MECWSDSKEYESFYNLSNILILYWLANTKKQRCKVKLVLDFQCYMYSSVDCPSAPYQFHKCNFEIIEVVWLSFRKLRE